MYDIAGTGVNNVATHPYTVRPNDYTTAGLWTEQEVDADMDLQIKSNAVITDNRIVRGDGGARLVQESTINVSDSGEMVNSSQPCFHVKPTVAQENLSVSTNHTIVFGTEIFDVGNNFASNTFTAPVTGKYQFNCNINVEGVSSTTNFISFKIVTSNRTLTYYYEPDSPSTLNYIGLAFSCLVDMDVSDTAYLQIYIGGGSATTDVRDTSNFSGILIA